MVARQGDMNMTMFFYSFTVLPENENSFLQYMNLYGNPTMSKYCQNWRLFKLDKKLTGNLVPEYIGQFEIPDKQIFFSSAPPADMIKTMEEAKKVCTNISEWTAEQVASNID